MAAHLARPLLRATRNAQNPPYEIWPQISNPHNQNPPGYAFPAFHSPPASATPHSILFPGSPHSSRDGKPSKFETKLTVIKGELDGNWAHGNHPSAPALLPRPGVDRTTARYSKQEEEKQSELTRMRARRL